MLTLAAEVADTTCIKVEVKAMALPKITSFLYKSDSGEYGNDYCSHCGAKGRYQWHFQAVTETGEIVKGSAMAGCIKLFPVSPIAKKQQALIEKQADYAKKGYELNRADKSSLEAIYDFNSGELSESEAIAIIARNDDGMRQWRKARSR